MTTALARKTSRAFLLVLFTPFLLGLVIVLELNAYQRSVDWVAHTTLVLSKVQVLRLAIIRAESSQRGFLLTTDQSYAVKFARAKLDASGEMSSIQSLTLDNKTQQQNLRRLQAAIDERFQILGRLMQRRSNGPFSTPEATELLDAGTGVMQNIWDASDRVQQHERALLQSRTQTVRETQVEMGTSFVVFTLINFAVLLWAYRLIEQYARDREEATQQMRRMNAELERRVADRTSELELAIVQLTRSNDDLTKFAYIASHDLQEPLRTIGSYVGLLSLRYKGQLDDQADKYIRFVVDGAKRMQNLVQDLLTYARIGSESLTLGPVNMELVLNNVRENLDFLLREQYVTIVSSPLPSLVADESKLTQVLMNLISNAIKFRKPDEAPRITIEASRSGAEWLFTLSDNGIGFDQQYADRIFAIFQRLHGVGAYPGTGMGLAICKRVIEQHEGKIWATSMPNVGSSFSFTLPVETPIISSRNLSKEQADRMGIEAVSK